jgi:hypothetical protein
VISLNTGPTASQEPLPSNPRHDSASGRGPQRPAGCGNGRPEENSWDSLRRGHPPPYAVAFAQIHSQHDGTKSRSRHDGLDVARLALGLADGVSASEPATLSGRLPVIALRVSALSAAKISGRGTRLLHTTALQFPVCYNRNCNVIGPA